MGVKGRPGLILNPQVLGHSHDLTYTDIREAVVRTDFGRAALEGGMTLRHTVICTLVEIHPHPYWHSGYTCGHDVMGLTGLASGLDQPPQEIACHFRSSPWHNGICIFEL